jgi:NADP-dependent 3-hydroxy acid dehydrogenase YdfG
MGTVERLAGRRILITGGSTGLGAALAAACVREGASVGVLARGAERLRAVAGAAGAISVAADIADPVSAAGAVEEIAGRLGGLDGLVNNAGVMLHSPIGAGYVDDWEQIFRVNVLGMLHVTHAALPLLRQAGDADLMTIASTSSDRVTAADFGVYSATKAAQARLVDGLRLELADAPRIRVSLVKPGFMNTPGLGIGTRDPDLRHSIVGLKERIGLPPETVAVEVLHLLALPWAVTIPEVTIVPSARA